MDFIKKKIDKFRFVELSSTYITIGAGTGGACSSRNTSWFLQQVRKTADILRADKADNKKSGDQNVLVT